MSAAQLCELADERPKAHAFEGPPLDVARAAFMSAMSNARVAAAGSRSDWSATNGR
jgi:hypothetical protein